MGSKFGTRNGYSIFECASAMQKSIRRGLVDEAMFWAVELELSQYGLYCWKRLRIIASEDIGMAEPMACVVVRTLFDNYVEQRKHKDAKSEREFMVHAVVFLATCPKSRAIDHANMVHFTDHDVKARNHPVPDFAYDQHTQKGRSMGRGVEWFFEESTQLDRAMRERMHPMLAAIQEGDDPWRDTAYADKLAGKETHPKEHGKPSDIRNRQTTIPTESEGDERD